MDIKYSKDVNKAIEVAHAEAKYRRHEFVCPEHLLHAMLQQDEFLCALDNISCDTEELKADLKDVLTNRFEQMPEDIQYEPENSQQTIELFLNAQMAVSFSGAEMIDIPHLTQAMIELKESWASYLLKIFLEDNVAEFISMLIDEYSYEYDDYNDYHGTERNEQWKSFVTCINDNLDNHNPLIGREQELEKTIRVLCRKEKNNPLLIGESGVGKTSIIYGLASKIIEGEVPEKLSGCHIYEIDMGGLIAGTQYRGEFEKRIKSIMSGVEKEGNAIVFIDEIHNLIGAGKIGDGSMDASNILKPYLECGSIRFIGSTTYEEYNKYFSSSKGMARRFQQIDILEPSIEDTVKILNGLIGKYEEYHDVKYDDGVIEYAVTASDKFIKDRFLPDKAIDLIDEAGAYMQIHKDEKNGRLVTKKLMAEILARICKTEAVTINEDNSNLEHLADRMKEQIYGQDEAIQKVTDAVLMSRAGLNDDNKPLANLLFVGPTGVGKTEIARVLASELGINLVRFDMSEYAEKHTVAKLIGSPAGYVGYEEGGLLTDAIRKTPNCVLLLDEIEKAHPDIFNILLQVMDYAVLTDNKGRKSDCRHLILIMTSNAGAQFAHQASIGFSSRVTAGDSMIKQIKMTFKPEFLNRLTATVVFNEMDKNMAQLILDKKLKEFYTKLNAQNVTVTMDESTREWFLEKSITKEYGAREMDRVISGYLKPLFVREILFGSLKGRGNAVIEIKDDKPVISQVNK